MAEKRVLQDGLVKFSRAMALLFNRATMYQMNHPFVVHSLEEFYIAAEKILGQVSPLILIMNRDQLFIDEESVNAHTNVTRILAHLKKTGIQSISFDGGLTKNEIKSFLEVFSSLDAYPNADAMKKALVIKGVRHVRINHVFFRKVTEDEEVISQDALTKLTPELAYDDRNQSRKLFVGMMLENLLAEELRNTLTMENLLRNPSELSEKMTETDLAFSKGDKAESRPPGYVLMHQLEILGEEVGRNLREEKGADLSEVAAALFDMKKRLLEGLDAQKSLNINYANEEMILDKINEITDNVVLRLVREEYQAGGTSTSRLAQIVRRLVPEPLELKRLLPKIREALMEEGMSLSEYLNLVQELGKELKSEELAKILQESSEEIGVDGEVLIEEIKRNPVKAAELIFLASEIRKGSGSDQALTDLLVDYVENCVAHSRKDVDQEDDQENETNGEQQLRNIMTAIEANTAQRFKGMDRDAKSDLLERLEERFNNRINEILEKVKLDWIHAHPSQADTKSRKELSVLELLEHSVAGDDELGEILETIRAKVQANEMDENDFVQIHAEIGRQQTARAQQLKEKIQTGFFEAPILTLLIEKEIARAKRYHVPFSALSFSLVRAVSSSSGPPVKFSVHGLMAAIYNRLSTIMRESDIIGGLGKNRIVVLLPMTSGSHARLALKRYMKSLHGHSIDVEGTCMTMRFAGVAADFEPVDGATATVDTSSFIAKLMHELAQMETRIKNLQIYL